jgi:exopolyphosphatase/guanosine-5'-triphosphate,3'-diphosphate pyrophosphatase
MNLRRYDRARVDGAWILGDEVGAVTNDLLSMTYEQRASSPCVGPERADLVLAGCAILEEIRNLWPADRIRVADRGLREGILTSLMNEDGNYARPT